MEALYQLFTVVVLAAGCLLGIRKGITGQLGSLLGCIFGYCGAVVLWRDLAGWIADTWPANASTPPMPMFLPSVLAVAVIYGGLYLVMSCLGPALRVITLPLGKGPLNKIVGAVWGVMKWAMLLSLFFNVLIGRDHDSPLMTAVRHNDGNIATGVMLIAPAITGTPDCEDLAYAIQLMEAQLFDRNHQHRSIVE